jgi:uncharacterized protein YlaI
MDFMAIDYCLSGTDKDAINEHLRQVEMPHAVCDACSTQTDLSFMRKLHDEPLRAAMCVPCFLRIHSDVEQDIIDRVVVVGERQGWYFNI